MHQTQQWKIGVKCSTSGHSPFVQMLCELFESFSERALIPNITVIVRAMQDMDVQHQLTLIDELVTTEHIDGLALMPLANTLVRDKINTLSEKAGHPCRDVQYGHHRREPHRLRRRGQHRDWRAAPSLRCSAWSCRGTAACCPFWVSAAVTMPTRSVSPASAPKWRRASRISGFCTRNARSSTRKPFRAHRYAHHSVGQRAARHLSDLCGTEGVYRAVHAAARSEKLHIVVHDITEGNIKMVKNGTVDFIIGQDVKTQGHASNPPALRLPRTPSVPEGTHEYHGYHGQIPLQRVTERSGKGFRRPEGHAASVPQSAAAPAARYRYVSLPAHSPCQLAHRAAEPFGRCQRCCSGSPSRIRRVLLISFGMTTRPRSSILLTIPVAFTLFCLPFTVVLLLWW